MSEKIVKEKLVVKFDEKILPLNSFVQKVIRQSVLAMLSTLKGVEIQGDENLEIIVKEASG